MHNRLRKERHFLNQRPAGKDDRSCCHQLDRAWSALPRLRAKVGAIRFRDLIVDLPDALEEIRSPDQRAVTEFYVFLGDDAFRAFLAEITDALETGNDPGTLWARWIDVVVERTPPKIDGPKGTT
jgi:hypothetical protein